MFVFVLVLAVLVAAAETGHFVIYGPYEQLGQYLEEAYSFYLSKNLKPLPPCGGDKYQVYFVDSEYADVRTSASCVESLNFPKGLSPVQLRHLAFHEVAHIFRLSYVPSDAQRSWYSEAVPEAMASVGSGVYYWSSFFFKEELYRKNPYLASEEDWYKYSAAFVWHLRSLSDWSGVVGVHNNDSYYIQFLLSIVSGMEMGGVRYVPRFEEYTLADSLNIELSLAGLSARYVKLNVPTPGFVLISAPGLLSNVALDKPIWIDNKTLYIALINPGRYTKTTSVRISKVQVSRPELSLVPVKAVINGTHVYVWARVVSSVGQVFGGSGLLSFEDPAELHGDEVFLKSSYSDEVVFRYMFLGKRGALVLSFPRPVVNITLIRASITPVDMSMLLNVSISICRPSVDAIYEVMVNGSKVVIDVPNGMCAVRYVNFSWNTPYQQYRKLRLVTNFGVVEKDFYFPPPEVSIRLGRWIINGSREWAEVVVEVNPVNYTYEIFGRVVSMASTFNLTIPAEGGVVHVDYGFGVETLERPRLGMSLFPILAEFGAPLRASVMIIVPSNLWIATFLSVMGNVTSFVGGPGTYAAELYVPPPSTPGISQLTVSLGPFSNSTTITWYRVNNLTITTPKLVPVGAIVIAIVSGRVSPPIPVHIGIEVEGCNNSTRGKMLLNSSITMYSSTKCTATIKAYTNTTSSVATVTWGSLQVSLQVRALGELRGLPIFVPQTLSVKTFLDKIEVPAKVRVVGDFDRLGLVNFTIVVEYMGVVNKTSFVGFAVPFDSYMAANKTLYMLPTDARPYFRYLVERAVATGDWAAVDKISRLYSELPTPFTLAARFLVERALAAGREPNVDAAEALRRLEPVVLGILGGFFLAVLRRGV